MREGVAAAAGNKHVGRGHPGGGEGQRKGRMGRQLVAQRASGVAR